MNDRCPNCKTNIVIGKEKLIDCPNCNKKLLLATINGVKQLFDVTPEELKKMNKLERKLKKYIESLDNDIDRLERTNFEMPGNIYLIDLTIATALRDVKEDLIEIMEAK